MTSLIQTVAAYRRSTRLKPALAPSVARSLGVCLASIAAPVLLCQTAPPPGSVAPTAGQASRAIGALPTPPQEQLPKRLFGIIPNYRSHPSLKDAQPLSSGEKFRLASRDSFDPGTFLLAGTFAAWGLASNSSPSYGHGMSGFGRYYASSYGSFAVGNFMTEAILPSMLHQDPRYFRRGTGGWSRLSYAIGQIFVTHGDNRRPQFNFSEIGGNAAAAAISNSYNRDNRTASDAATNLGIQLGIDMAGNIVKEFGPDLYRKFSRQKHLGSSSQVHP